MKPKPTTIEKEIAKAKVAGFQLGVRCASVIATMLVREGWKDLDKLPDEVVTRARGVVEERVESRRSGRERGQGRKDVIPLHRLIEFPRQMDQQTICSGRKSMRLDPKSVGADGEIISTD